MEMLLKTRQAYSEIDEFIHLLNKQDRNKIPKKLREFFSNEKDKEYIKNINIDVPIKEQNLREETLAIIAILNLKYWCEDKEEKKRLMQVYINNEKKYQKILQVAFNSDDVFKNKKKEK